MITITSTVEILDHTYCLPALTNFFSSGSRPFGHPPELPDRPVRPWVDNVVLRTYSTILLSLAIIGRIMMHEKPPFRPVLPHDTGRLMYQDLMTSCWDEDLTMRPSCDDIMKSLKKVNGGKLVIWYFISYFVFFVFKIRKSSSSYQRSSMVNFYSSLLNRCVTSRQVIFW